MDINIGSWYYADGIKCQVVSIDTRIEPVQVFCWFPSMNTVQTLCANKLSSLTFLDEDDNCSSYISFVANSQRISELLYSNAFLSQNKFLAPLEAKIDPLPHQLEILQKVMANDHTRFMLADEVGLGKTIEAGLILEELILRNEAKRILIVVPKGLAFQWQMEMKNHFDEDFKFIPGSDIPNLDNLFAKEGGVWKQFDKVIVSHDSIKPVQKRKGWSKEKIANYNKIRLGDLLAARWDLIIIDEAHRLGGSTSNVARYKLGKALSEASERLLLLTATPHQGKSDSFFRLLNILDEKAFPDEESIDRDLVKNYAVRTEKRTAVDSNGDLLFKPRITISKNISWGEGYERHQELYEKVSDYVKHGYNQAIVDKKPHIGFLMVLLQRLITSSTNAIQTTLSRRLDVLNKLKDNQIPEGMLSVNSNEEFEDLSTEEQIEDLIISSDGVLDEISQVEDLLKLATICKNSKDDKKTLVLEALINDIKIKEKKPKFLIFTEFVPTQNMLNEFLEVRGYSVVCINGSMTIEERKLAQSRFAKDSDILISTDAGGEGLNLQFCHIVINYDLPWNPMKIEQRIGRVDRIGQKKTVCAYNLLLQDSVECHVREVLEKKLSIIADEFGVDKTSDVLESDTSAKAYIDALTASVMEPCNIDGNVEYASNVIRSEMEGAKSVISYLDNNSSMDNNQLIKLEHIPVSYWVEHMLDAYFKYTHKGSMKENKNGFFIDWGDGNYSRNAVFRKEKKEYQEYIGLGNYHVNEILKGISPFVKGDLVPSVMLCDLPSSIDGYWAIFDFTLNNDLLDSKYLKISNSQKSIFPIFVTSDGIKYDSAAQRIWTELTSQEIHILNYNDEYNSQKIYEVIANFAYKEAEIKKEEFLTLWDLKITQEIKRLHNFYQYQADNKDKAGLDEVKQYRQKQLALFNADIDREIQLVKTIHPVLKCVYILEIKGHND